MIEYIPAAIQGVGSIINAISGRKNRTPKFEDTAYGKYIKQVSEQGAYSPDIQQQILNQLSSKVGSIAQMRRARTRGHLTSRGMSDSVAGASLLDEPGQDVQRTLGNEAQDLLIKNALSKINAGQQYAQGINQTDAVRRNENKAITGGLVNGLAGAAGSAVNAYQWKEQRDYDRGMEIQDLNKINTLQTIQILLNSSDPEDKKKAREMIANMGK